MTRAADDVRRRAPRLETQLEGTLLGRTPRPVTVIDLSETGCLVQCAGCPEPGSILDLEIQLGDGPLRTKVRVAEASLDGVSLPSAPPRYLAGLAFLGLPVREESRLLRFLDDERRRRCASGP